MSDLTRKASSIVTVLYRCMTGEDPATFSNGGISALHVAAAHGYPSTKAMHANIAALRPLRDLPVTFDIPAPEGQPAMTNPDSIDALLEQAASHDKAKVRNAAQGIHARLDKLRDLIEADSEDAKRREEIARLEAKIAALKGKPTKVRQSPEGDVPCPVDDCERTFTSSQAVAMHKRRAHEGFDPKAAA